MTKIYSSFINIYDQNKFNIIIFFKKLFFVSLKENNNFFFFYCYKFDLIFK